MAQSPRIGRLARVPARVAEGVGPAEVVPVGDFVREQELGGDVLGGAGDECGVCRGAGVAALGLEELDYGHGLEGVGARGGGWWGKGGCEECGFLLGVVKGGRGEEGVQDFLDEVAHGRGCDGE